MGRRKSERSHHCESLVEACRAQLGFLAEAGYEERVSAGFPECHVVYVSGGGSVQVISEYYGAPSVSVAILGQGALGVHEAMAELEPERWARRPAAKGALSRDQMAEWVGFLGSFLRERRHELLDAPLPLLRRLEERRRQEEVSWCGDLEAASEPFGFLRSEHGYQGPWPYRGPAQCSLNYTNGDRSVLLAVDRDGGYRNARVYVTPGGGAPHFDLSATMAQRGHEALPTEPLAGEPLRAWVRAHADFLRAHPELLGGETA
jgi:hypothetical protein